MSGLKGKTYCSLISTPSHEMQLVPYFVSGCNGTTVADLFHTKSTFHLCGRNQLTIIHQSGGGKWWIFSEPLGIKVNINH